MKKKQTNYTQNSKDPERIQMNDIFQILKDQKQKIDHLLRQTQNDLQQNNSRIKGFWNSSSNNAEPSTIPCKVLNNIQGYESNADKINNILHKKVNQLKRITMKKKTYEENEQRDIGKQAFTRYVTPDIRMKFKSQISENEQKQQDLINKKLNTYSNSRAGSVQLDSNDPNLAPERWSKRQKLNQQPSQKPIKEIENKSKAIGVLKRKSIDTTKVNLEEITKIYSPRAFVQKQKLDSFNGQSVIVESSYGLKDQFLNKSMDITNEHLDMVSMNSARNKNSKDLENLVSNDKFIDKQNNQQYLLKQVQLQNIKLTEKQNQILYRQLLEQSQQNNREGEYPTGGNTPSKIRRNSIASDPATSTNQMSSTGFLPQLNIHKKNNLGEENQIDDQIYNANGQVGIQANQKKYGNSSNEIEQTKEKSKYQNEDFPQIHGGKYINIEVISQRNNQLNNSQQSQNDVIKHKRSQSLQQQNTYNYSRKNSSNNEEKLDLINKYKQAHLIVNSEIKIPSESEIYPLNILKNKNYYQENFSLKERNEIPQTYERSNYISVNQQSLSNKENSQRYSYDLNCHSVPLITNHSFSSQKDGGSGIPINNNDHLNTEFKQIQYQYDQRDKNISDNQKIRREQTSQHTIDARNQMKNTELSTQKPPLRDNSKNQFGSSRLSNNNQCQQELMRSQDSLQITAENKFQQKDGFQQSEYNESYEFLPNQVNFSVKKEDLYQKNKEQHFEAITNMNINEDLKNRLQQNFLSRLGLSGVFPSSNIEQNQDRVKNRTQQNSPKENSFDSKNGENNQINKQKIKSNQVKFNDPNLFNYHKLIGCANLDEKSKKMKAYQHYHSNEREKQEKKYYEVLNEKLNYQIEINLLYLEQQLLKSKSQTKKQLLDKLKAFRQEIVEASQSQERSIQNLKRQYKHLYSFNLPESLFIN